MQKSGGQQRGNRRGGRGGRGGRNSAANGRQPMSSMSTPASGSSTPSRAPIERVATPPLEITIPADTPRFAELAQGNLVNEVLLKTLQEDMKFDHMTPVQAATIHQLLSDRQDVLAQAKTGTGKTTAFLLPAIQSLLNRKRNPGKYISLLVISPTRELALQIAKEAEKILQRMPQYRVCTAIGGTNKNTEEKALKRGCDLLIGTPGRLLDHITGENGVKGDSDVAEKLQQLDTLVLDEADRLLDMGFLPALRDIIGCLPDKKSSGRQGMLFSATVPEHVQKVAHLALDPDYKYISTIPKGESNTHERVPQHLVVVPTFSDMCAGLIGALRQERQLAGVDNFKAIVFAQTAAQVEFYADVINATDLGPVVTLHSRATQSKRTRVTEEFRAAKNGILIATDVVARGMDFPLVTNVFQAGIPMDKESYIHRLGRTARAGAEGRGTFVITAHEAYFPKYTLKDIDFIDVAADLSAQRDVEQITERMDTQAKTYQAWIGFYKTLIKPLGWDVDALVRHANTYARDGLGSPEVPTINKSTVGKMGMKGVKGLNVVPDPPKVGRRPAGGNGDQGAKRQRK